jgi:hypothetical protein
VITTESHRHDFCFFKPATVLTIQSNSILTAPAKIHASLTIYSLTAKYSAGPKILVLWNPKVQHCILKSQPLSTEASYNMILTKNSLGNTKYLTKISTFQRFFIHIYGYKTRLFGKTANSELCNFQPY